MTTDVDVWREAAGRAAHEVAALGWTPATGGNLSVDLGDARVPRGEAICLELAAAVPGLAGRTLLISRSGCRLRRLDPGADLGLVRILPQGDRAEAWLAGDAVPTYELDAHLALHAACRATGRDERAVLHVHPPHLIALTRLAELADPQAIESALLGAHPEVAFHFHRGVGLVPYERSGAPALALRTAEQAARGVDVVVWALHGCFGLGEDLEHCRDRVEMLENAARIHLAALGSGRPVRELSPDEIRELRRLGARGSPWEEGGSF
jgi:rhamnulose-1-phosphate aldolase